MSKLFSKIFVKKKTKGQAALEYMITYGWAFIVIIAAISVLGYFGFLNPSKYIPESCEFGEQLKCIDHYVDDDGQVIFRFRNNFETDIELIRATGDAEESDIDETIADGAVKKITLDSTKTDLFPGTKERFDIEFTFKRVGGSHEHKLSGSVFAEVVEGELNLI
ncbi:MAG: hypothetical protein U9R00_00045 [Patescibacteria group bacterium]|nr:hypothetical protein [Patescibacteria group bacterium]